MKSLAILLLLASADAPEEKFSKAIYAEVQEEEGNLFISPLNIYYALGMLYPGAKNKVKEEFEDVLHVTDLDRHKEIGNVFHGLEEAIVGTAPSKFIFRSGSSVWADSHLTIRDKYVQDLRDNFDTKLGRQDFRDRPEAALETINKWVEQRSTIKNLFNEEIINDETLLVIASALYLKAEWAFSFNEIEEPQDFFVKGEVVKAEMMSSLARYNFYQDDDITVVEVPIKGPPGARDKKFSFVILMPKDFAKLERKYTSTGFDRYFSRMEPAGFRLIMPKFKFESEYKLTNTLKSMGLKAAFEDPQPQPGRRENQRNFDISSQDLKISEVVHKAKIEVNKDGLEAAAATGGGLVAAGGVSEFITIDRPFMFLIREKNTNLTFFMGRFVDPQ